MDRSAKFFGWRGASPVRQLFRALPPRKVARALALTLLGLLCVRGAENVELKTDDIVGFVGGADVAAAQHTGHLESLLTLAHPGVRFRNFGWEGDTVFAQPRDFNFPPLPDHILKAGATIIFVQFGRMEIFAENAAQFRPNYEKVLDTLAQTTSRLVLVTPIPFEQPGEPLPDLSRRNSDLEKIAADIREIAKQRHLPLIDLYSALLRQGDRFTEDGLQLTPRGHGVVALAFAKELGLKNEPKLAANSAWQEKDSEDLRQLIIAKNRLWFDYWRPQNWAFLGGDRVEQPSSRDHRDPKIRWFPEEMQKFEPLISQKENEIAARARRAADD